MQQGKRWAQAAGATVVSEDSEDGIEVSPLISYVCCHLILIDDHLLTLYRVEKDWKN
jgi:hypothetical protein